MGAFFSSLSRQSSTERKKITINFIDPVTTEKEESACHELSEIIKSLSSTLEKLENFKGCEDEIKSTITNPQNPDYQKAAWDALSSRVSLLKELYEFTRKTGQSFVNLLGVLASESRGCCYETLKEKQATCKCLADLLNFTSRFDELRTKTSSIQNIFPFYRRLLQRYQDEELEVNDELASEMSLFFASSFPALLVIIEMTSDYLKKEENKTDLILNLILALASVCKDTLDTPNCLEKLKSSNKDELILRAMVESTVVYDHLSPAGAFCKKSAFPMRPVIQTVKNFSQESVSKELLGVLQHRSKHFNDPDTPRHLQLLIK